MKEFEGRKRQGCLRRQIGFTSLLLAATLAVAQAGNREEREARELRRAELAPAAVAQPAMNVSPHGHTALFVTNSETKLSKKEQRSAKEVGPKERKRITIYHFNSRFGDVSVQPLVGSINGAQLSVGF